MKNVEISVIIPAFNAEKYLQRSIASALKQRYVKEVLVIDDGSIDGTVGIILAFVEKDSRVKLLRHANGDNCGVSKSRNLGIQNAESEFISFLDADDYYLDNRFDRTEITIRAHPELDGVYEAMGTEFETAEDEISWVKAKKRSIITTMTVAVSPERLFFEIQPIGLGGFIAMGGWTIRRSFFEKCGYFQTHLDYGEDTELYLRMAVLGRFYAGEINCPVGVRVVHSQSATARLPNPYELFYRELEMWISIWKSIVLLGSDQQKKAVARSFCGIMLWYGEFPTYRLIPIWKRLAMILKRRPRFLIEGKFLMGLLITFKNLAKVRLG